ncbi:uncharacterized protein LOC110674111 [Aedes aegypti]|uniref:Uncharacterized protein n=1 Tax=Aedes aegypti TaxID=7159 RepID=A0A6I8TTC3_AEDAE
MFSIIIVIVSINSLYWSLIHYVSGLFKVVRLKLLHFSTFSSEKSRIDELNNIIELHDVIFRSARSLEEALNVYMLIQFGTCIIMICMTLMVLILAIDDRDLLIKMVLMMSFILFHILVYSLLGSELMAASALVANAVYEVPWYQWSVAEQRKVLFVWMRSAHLHICTLPRLPRGNFSTSTAKRSE